MCGSDFVQDGWGTWESWCSLQNLVKNMSLYPTPARSVLATEPLVDKGQEIVHGRRLGREGRSTRLPVRRLGSGSSLCDLS